MWALVQFDWCPVKKRRWGHTEEHRNAHVEKGPCEDTALCRPGERPQEKTNLPTGSWTCSLQSCENINPCCFSPPACGTLLWQLTQTSMCSDQHVPLCYVVMCVYVGKRWEGICLGYSPPVAMGKDSLHHPAWLLPSLFRTDYSLVWAGPVSGLERK